MDKKTLEAYREARAALDAHPVIERDTVEHRQSAAMTKALQTIRKTRPHVMAWISAQPVAIRGALHDYLMDGKPLEQISKAKEVRKALDTLI